MMYCLFFFPLFRFIWTGTLQETLTDDFNGKLYLINHVRFVYVEWFNLLRYLFFHRSFKHSYILLILVVQCPFMQKTCLGGLRAYWDSGSGWFCMLAVGVITGIIACIIDIGSTWMSDLKEGVCLEAFWFNRDQCCWSSNQTDGVCEQVSRYNPVYTIWPCTSSTENSAPLDNRKYYSDLLHDPLAIHYSNTPRQQSSSILLITDRIWALRGLGFVLSLLPISPKLEIHIAPTFILV